MAFEKPKITPRRRIEVPEEARREARAGMGGEATRAATEPTPQLAPAPEPERLEPVKAPESIAPTPVATAPAATPARRGRKPAITTITDEDVPLHTVQVPKTIVQEIKLSLLLATPGPEMPTTIKSYLEAAHRHYDAYLRKVGKLPPLAK